MPKIQKSADNSKYNRINLIYERLLKSAHGVTISELASELNVSTKTIQRDLYEVLSEFGAQKQGRYWMINPQKTQDNLNSNERIVLGILDEMAKSAGRAFYSKAHSLLAQITQQLEHPIFTHISSETLEEKDIETFEIIEQAIKDKKQISFVYKKHTFELKPLKLAFFDGFWYVLALHTQQKDMFKKFHLKSIKHVTVLDKDFSVPLIVEKRLKYANSVWFNLDEPFSVQLFIDKEVRKYFERKPLPSQMIMGEDSDGSIEIEVKITHGMEIKPLIYLYIPYVKVLEPQWLVDVIKKDVGQFLEDINE